MASPVKHREWEKTLTVKCRLCGGAKCKRCSESAALAKSDSPVLGLHADWVTDRILGMMRPSTRLMKDYQIARQFHQLKIAAVFNLTIPGEHPYCGDGLGPSGFPYDPETDLMAETIQFFNFGWEDMTTPTLPLMLDIVKVMASVLQDGHQKIAVHCHAGYGRTGIAIACVLIFMHNIPPDVAIKIVRRDRPGSVQTSAQAKFVRRFHEYINASRVVFALPRIHDPFSLSETIEHQNRVAHGESSMGVRLALPRILDFLCSEVEAAADSNPLEVINSFIYHVPLHHLRNKPHSEVHFIRESHLKTIFEAGKTSNSVNSTMNSSNSASSFGRSATSLVITTAPPPVPSVLMNSEIHQISQDDVFPVKVALNAGEWNWAAAIGLCQDTAAYVPALLLDWLEHLREPILDKELPMKSSPAAGSPQASNGNGDTNCRALNHLPVCVVRSLERVINCVRLLEKKAFLTDDSVASPSNGALLFDALCVRLAMALFHLHDDSSNEALLVASAEFVLTLMKDWRAPKRLELNMESIQKIGSGPSFRRLPLGVSTKPLDSGAQSPSIPSSPLPISSAAPATSSPKPRLSSESANSVPPSIATPSPPSISSPVPPSPKPAKAASESISLVPVIHPRVASGDQQHSKSSDIPASNPKTSVPVEPLPQQHQSHHTLVPLEPSASPVKSDCVMPPQLHSSLGSSSMTPQLHVSASTGGIDSKKESEFACPSGVTTEQPRTGSAQGEKHSEVLSPTAHASSICSLPSVKGGDRYKHRAI